MAVPWSNLIPARSRVLPQGGAILGQLTGTFQTGLEQGRMRAAEDQAPDLLLNYLETQGQGYQPTLGNLATPAAGYVGGQQAPPPAQFDGRPTIANAQQQQAATGGGVDAGVQLLDQFEGFRATPYEDWSYRPGTGERYMSGMRIGYGQTIPGAQNITQEQAQAALRQQIEQQYIPSIVGTVGADVWGRLNPDQQGVLISLAHNYGSIPGRIVPALQSGDSAAAASAIAALGGDNSGINQRRREQEAMAFAGTGQPMAGGAPSGGMPATGGGYSSQPAWSPPTGAERAQLRALMINPATRQMGYQLAIQRMTPPEPTQPNWQLQEFNGTLYRVDANTGQAQPVIQGQGGGTDPADIVTVNGQLVNRRTGEVVGDYRDPQDAAGAGFRPLVDPAERAAMGIPATDAGFYQVGPDGRVYRESGGGTNVEVNLPGQPMIGTIPAGWQATEVEGGGYTMNPIPGGPADRETIEAQQAREINAAWAERQTGVLMTTLSNAEEIVQRNPGGTTGWGELLARLPASESRTLQSLLDTAKAIVGFETLQAMRDASPTGGALGAITERELAFLQSVQGSLDQGLSSDILLRNIQAIAASVERWNQAVQAARGQTGAGGQTGGDPVQVRTPADWEALAPGTPYIDPDGVPRIRQ